MSLALNHLHTRYQRGGSLQTGQGTDCSGFVRHVYQNLQIELPHSSAQQARLGKVAARHMDLSKLEVGDLLFFRRSRSIDHVGIYMGEGQMIHASSRRRGVIITDLRQSYFTDNFVVAKRLLVKPQP
ncbi:MAG: C40 family peptidase [Deltaproteobacteria bacterium]|nr:C40 family peptidase [Deltaproteobacteria bacterium]MBI4794746.1 C40 family peptidase [Deltaproteobacteria bacterium]